MHLQVHKSSPRKGFLPLTRALCRGQEKGIERIEDEDFYHEIQEEDGKKERKEVLLVVIERKF